MSKTHLLEFYGAECPHCAKMKPLVDQLEEDLKVIVERLEVWHNEENLKLQSEYDKDICGGVPFFINTKTGATICGEADYNQLKDWTQ